MAAGLIAGGLLLRRAGVDFAVMLPDRGVRGAGVFCALATAVLLLGFSRQAVAFAGGAAFGAGAGGTLAWLAALMSAVGAYGLARGAWRRPVRLPRWLVRAEGGLRARPFLATLTIRLLPIGNSLALSLLCGSMRVPFWQFAGGSALGFLPQTAIFALLGAGVQLGAYTTVLAAAALLAASILGGVVLIRAAMVTERSFSDTPAPVVSTPAGPKGPAP